MGINKSRNMARAAENRGPEDTSNSEDGSSDESDLASILQYLIRSGQVRILGREQPYFGAYPRQPFTGTPNLDNLYKSEIYHLTKRSAGVVTRGPRPTTKNFVDLISMRESGLLTRGSSFSRSERCAVTNTKLPCKKFAVDTYENKAFCGVYSHNGNTLLTASQDRYMRLYDASNGRTFKELQTIQGRDIGWAILDTAFSPDSSKIAYSSWSTSIHLVDVHGNEIGRHSALPLCPTERRFCVFSLTFSQGGNEILCSANDGHLYIYDLQANDRTLSIEAHDDDANTVAFADETSQILYSGGDDGLCKVWDRRTLSEACPSPVGALAGHLDGVTYIDSRGDGRHFISNSKDQSIKLWDIRVMSSKSAQENSRRAVSNNKWDYRWQTAPRKLVTRKSNIKGDTSVATYRGHSVLQTLIRCHFSPAFTTGQRYIVSGCAFGRVVIYDILTGAVVQKIPGHSSCVRDVSWHPYRNEIVSTSWDFSVLCWSQIRHTEADKEESDADAEEQETEEEGAEPIPLGPVIRPEGVSPIRDFFRRAGGRERSESPEVQGLRRSRRIANRARMQ